MFMQFAVATLVSVGLSVGLFGDIVRSDADTPADNPSRTDTQLDQLLNGEVLKVKEAVGDPQPLKSNLQSPKGQSDQSTQKNLQVPGGNNLQRGSSGGGLQPNAGLSEFPSE